MGVGLRSSIEWFLRRNVKRAEGIAAAAHGHVSEARAVRGRVLIPADSLLNACNSPLRFFWTLIVTALKRVEAELPNAVSTSA